MSWDAITAIIIVVVLAIETSMLVMVADDWQKEKAKKERAFKMINEFTMLVRKANSYYPTIMIKGDYMDSDMAMTYLNQAYREIADTVNAYGEANKLKNQTEVYKEYYQHYRKISIDQQAVINKLSAEVSRLLKSMTDGQNPEHAENTPVLQKPAVKEYWSNPYTGKTYVKYSKTIP